MAMFNSFLYVYQKVVVVGNPNIVGVTPPDGQCDGILHFLGPSRLWKEARDSLWYDMAVAKKWKQ